MTHSFILQKMESDYDPKHFDQPIKYRLSGAVGSSQHAIDVNQCLGKRVTMSFTGRIFCLNCLRQIKKTFNGFCYPCAMKLARADFCQLKPETCHYDKGTCRDSKWAEKNCFIPHSLYLSYTSGVKVGITRSYQKETRWVDQGAVIAMELGTVNSRHKVGLIEVQLAKYFKDKTHWTKMLKLKKLGKNERELLYEGKEKILTMDKVFSAHQDFKFVSNPTMVDFLYPNILPNDMSETKIKSLSFEKKDVVNGILLGIKGQYLYFSSGLEEIQHKIIDELKQVEVINIRKFEGYEIAWSIDEF